MQTLSRDGGEPDIIDLRIRAPRAAASNGNLELPRQIVKLGVAAQLPIQLRSQGRSVAVLVRVKPGQRAAGNISYNVTAGAGGRQTHVPKRLQNFRQRFNRHPVKLEILPHGNVRDAARVTLGEVRDRARLMTAQEAVGNSDAHHKEWRRFAFAILAADHAGAVSLGVNAPRTEIRTQPFRRDRSVPLPRKRPDLVEMLPGILLALQPLDSLCFGFLDFAHVLPWKCSVKTKNPRSPDLWQRGLRNFCLR